MDNTVRTRLRALAEKCQQDCTAAHRADHTHRVVWNAGCLAEHYPEADRDALEAAGWLHDVGRGSERCPGVSHAEASAKFARRVLPECGFSPSQVTLICQAIADHRYSGGCVPSSLEGQLLQDADRLDALGAIGIARTFAEGGMRDLYHADDPFAKHRSPDDRRFTLDHFFRKLLLLADTLHTPEAREHARRRTETMRSFLREFADELASPCT